MINLSYRENERTETSKIWCDDDDDDDDDEVIAEWYIGKNLKDNPGTPSKFSLKGREI
jgi:hypothetical protein